MRTNISLRELTALNWLQAAQLEVKPEQAALVASNLFSLAESRFGLAGMPHLRLVPLAIYHGEEMVGFLMYNAPPENDRFFIMRLMIGAAHQRQGFGRAALQVLVDGFKAHPQAKEVALNYEPQNEAARQLYASLGFEEVERSAENGVVAWRALNEQAEPWESMWKSEEGRE